LYATPSDGSAMATFNPKLTRSYTANNAGGSA